MANDYDWVEPYTERVINFLGLQVWAWSLEHQTGLGTSQGARHVKADATCDADSCYLNATITIDSQFYVDRMKQPSLVGKTLLCHEVLHIAFESMSHAMEQIVNVYFPSEDGTPSGKTTAFTIYSDAEEQTIVRLARQIYAALEREDELRRFRKRNKALKRKLRRAHGSD